MRERLADALLAWENAELERVRAEDCSRNLRRSAAEALASQERAVVESRALQSQLAEERERFTAERRREEGVRDVLRADISRLQRRLAAAEAAAQSSRAAEDVSRGDSRLPAPNGAGDRQSHLPTEQGCMATAPASGKQGQTTGTAELRNRRGASAMEPAAGMEPRFPSDGNVAFRSSAPQSVPDDQNAGRLETSRAAVIMSLISSCSPQPSFRRFACPRRG